jgi:carbon monoxide dehydrogenase subunit G
MLTVDESIVINKPRAEVWDFLSDPENVTVYSSNVVEYDVVEGERVAVGRKAHGVVKVAGRRLELTDEVVDLEEGVSMTTASEDATVPYRLTIRLEDADGGTRVDWHQEMESLKGVFKLADPLVLKLYSRDVRSNLEKAKTILEA